MPFKPAAFLRDGTGCEIPTIRCYDVRNQGNRIVRKFAFGALLGAIVYCVPAAADEAGGPLTITVPGWWSIPFLLLLSCIAFVPFIHKPFWEKFFGHISIGLGLLVAAIY